MNCSEPCTTTGAAAGDEHLSIRRLLTGARCVLFDFDGPLCHLFRELSSTEIAAEMHDRVARLRRRHGLPDLAPERADSPVHILAEASRVWLDDPAVALLERFLRKREKKAARRAPLTPGAAELVRDLVARGIGVAVATNNSEQVVEGYLRRQSLAEPFAGRVYGRQDMSQGHALTLKPDPHCINRAMKDFPTLEQENFLMIGDSTDDVLAARAAGVRFIGFMHPDGGAAPEGCPRRDVVDSMSAIRAMLPPPSGPPAGPPPPE